MDKKLKIFISYSHFDKELAQKLYNNLTDNGYEVIWDENIIVPGDNFSSKLNNALYGADIYLPIISDDFERSRFTNSELLRAIGYNSSRERPRIFPYIVKGKNIPIELSTMLCFMGTDNISDDLNRILIELEKIKGSIFAINDINNEIVDNLNISLDTYLKDVFTKLDRNEKRNKILAYICYTISVVFLFLIIPFAILKSSDLIFQDNEIMMYIIVSIKSFVILTVLAALSRLMFILGKSFMVESIRNGDRIHAISFGKFYIQAYGKTASRQEIREVLGEWNIDKGSSFQTQDAKEIDPNFLGTLEVIKSYFEHK